MRIIIGLTSITMGLILIGYFSVWELFVGGFTEILNEAKSCAQASQLNVFLGVVKIAGSILSGVILAYITIIPGITYMKKKEGE